VAGAWPRRRGDGREDGGESAGDTGGLEGVDVAGRRSGRGSGRGGRRRGVPWQDNPELRVDVPAASTLCQWSFTDELTAVVALHPHLPGFSRLEFLGDAVLNLAIYLAATVTGLGRDVASSAVANAQLDKRINASPLVDERRSGDVLEALVGAVHLDGGFTAAWVASLRIAGPAAGIPLDLPPPPTLDLPGGLDERAGAFVGAALLAAVVADRLARTEPDWSDDRYSSERSRLLATARLADLARRHLRERLAGHADGSCADVLQTVAARRLVDEGWPGGVAAAVDFGVLPA
jgi:hypothetical protein